MKAEEVVTQVEQKDEQTEYVAPRIESVMTPDDLVREVQYAGVVATP